VGRGELGQLSWGDGLSGLGVSPLGVSAYGYGTPAVAPTPGGNVYKDRFGVVHGSRNISLVRDTAGQYTYDEFGRAQGMSDTHQLVILASKTILGSSASTALGHRFSEIRYVGDDFAKQMTGRVNEAFKSLVDQGLIRIDSIEVEPGDGRPAKTRVKLTDLFTDLPLPDVIL